MSLGPLLVRDQFAKAGREGVAITEFGLAGVALLPGLAAYLFNTRISALSGLLTATSILTGLTFTMAMRFWERSLDARSDPKTLSDGRRLQFLDKMRAHLVWTVTVGVVATGFLALSVIFTNSGTPVWVSVVAAFLVMYEVLLVGGALLKFYDLAYLLRP